jgi:hypothetical protein
MWLNRLALGCAWSSAFVLMAARAAAEDSATAGALFEKGVADMEASRFDSACPAIEESQRIDPRPGTLFTLAECNARWGKVASSAAQYQEYVDLVSRLTTDQQARHKARVEIARTQLKKLKPTVPTLTLVLPADAPRGTFVTRNGEVLKGAALGLPLPIDPGEYLIVTHVPGAPDRETRVSIQLNDQKRLPLEVASAQEVPANAAPAAPPSAPSSAAEHVAATPETHGSNHKTAAYVAGGIGLAGIAVGSVTGVLVFSKKHTVSGNCSGAECNDTGLAAANSGKNLAFVSDIGFGVGIAGLALGAVFLLSGGADSAATEHAHATRVQPLLVAGNGGVGLGLLRRW